MDAASAAAEACVQSVQRMLSELEGDLRALQKQVSSRGGTKEGVSEALRRIAVLELQVDGLRASVEPSAGPLGGAGGGPPARVVVELLQRTLDALVKSSRDVEAHLRRLGCTVLAREAVRPTSYVASGSGLRVEAPVVQEVTASGVSLPVSPLPACAEGAVRDEPLSPAGVEYCAISDEPSTPSLEDYGISLSSMRRIAQFERTLQDNAIAGGATAGAAGGTKESEAEAVISGLGPPERPLEQPRSSAETIASPSFSDTSASGSASARVAAAAAAAPQNATPPVSSPCFISAISHGEYETKLPGFLRVQCSREFLNESIAIINTFLAREESSDLGLCDLETELGFGERSKSILMALKATERVKLGRSARGMRYQVLTSSQTHRI